MVKLLLAGLAASLVWFVIGGGLYMNPWIAKIYKDAKSSPGFKKWESIPQYLGAMFLVMLIPNILWALVYSFIKPVLPQDLIAAASIFALILIAIKIIPRLFDMWIQSTYPNRLLLIELVNGSIGSLVIGIVFAYLI